MVNKLEEQRVSVQYCVATHQEAVIHLFSSHATSLSVSVQHTALLLGLWV